MEPVWHDMLAHYLRGISDQRLFEMHGEKFRWPKRSERAYIITARIYGTQGKWEVWLFVNRECDKRMIEEIDFS
jgi:hypothetical protein